MNKKVAEIIFVETGGDMDAFARSQDIASWGGMCPGNNESAGKRRGGRNTGGNRWLREILVEAATAAARTRNTFLRARYDRLARRRGAKRARFAIAHRILVIAYDILKNKNSDKELGVDYYNKSNAAEQTKRHVKQLQRLGYNVALQPAEA